MWEVRRHGGLGAHTWRAVLRTNDEVRARHRYDKERSRMKQGGIELRDPSGNQVQHSWLPIWGHRQQSNMLHYAHSTESR